MKNETISKIVKASGISAGELVLVHFWGEDADKDIANRFVAAVAALGANQTVWVMAQGLIQTLLVRLPLAYYMSVQPNASLTNIGLSAPIATVVGIILNVIYYIYIKLKKQTENAVK